MRSSSLGNLRTNRITETVSWYDKLRIIRKRWWKKYFSQHGEDLVVGAIFEDMDSGIYVDIGSFHPRRYSNTRVLYKRGWRGVNVDISAKKIALFDFDRPDDHNIFCAASDRHGELTAYVFGRGSALDTTDSDVAEARAKQFDMPYKIVTVPCRPLADILAGCNVSAVDYLNIDVEGAELSVLHGLDFSKYLPKCISVEIHGELEEAMNSATWKFLAERSYILHSWVRPTFIFFQPDKDQAT